MIKIYLKSPYREIFIAGNLDDNFAKRMVSGLSEAIIETFFLADIMVVKQNERAPYDMDFKNVKKGGKVLIPVSNIAYMKDVEEG